MLRVLRPVALPVLNLFAAISTMSTSSTQVAPASDVLSFWFGEANGAQARREWFVKNAEFDEEIRSKFLPNVEAAGRGELKSWEEHPDSALALVITMDQFPRNLFRNDPKSFSLDPEARRVAKDIIKKEWDVNWPPFKRSFVLLPLMHSENIEDQKLCVELHKAIEKLVPDFAMNTKFAVQHMEIVEKFGRFPHRNEILGRPATEEEENYLANGGARF